MYFIQLIIVLLADNNIISRSQLQPPRMQLQPPLCYHRHRLTFVLVIYNQENKWMLSRKQSEDVSPATPTSPVPARLRSGKRDGSSE